MYGDFLSSILYYTGLSHSKKILDVGSEHRGMYYLKDKPLNGIDGKMEDIRRNILEIE